MDDLFCVPCRRKLRVQKAGQDVLELTAAGGAPYKVMTGDVLECPSCGLRIVTRFGKVTASHEADFDSRLRGFRRLGMLEVI